MGVITNLERPLAAKGKRLGGHEGTRRHGGRQTRIHRLLGYPRDRAYSVGDVPESGTPGEGRPGDIPGDPSPSPGVLH